MTSWFRQFCIYVSDIDATIRFYETLGLTCTSRTQITDDIEEAMIENPDRGGWIQLAHDRSKPDAVQPGTSVWKLYVYTDDCQGLHDRAVAAGYRSHMAPERLERWPVLMAYIEDPDGYLVELLQRDVPATPGGAGGSVRDQNA